MLNWYLVKYFDNCWDVGLQCSPLLSWQNSRPMAHYWLWKHCILINMHDVIKALQDCFPIQYLYHNKSVSWYITKRYIVPSLIKAVLCKHTYDVADPAYVSGLLIKAFIFSCFISLLLTLFRLIYLKTKTRDSFCFFYSNRFFFLFSSAPGSI